MLARTLTLVLLVALAAWPLAGQTPLTLPQAVEIALEQNPTRKAALADQRAAAAGIQSARAQLWPVLSFSESFTRSNDPVYVFGTKLRQQRFTTADFDLARLNTPTPLNNFNTRFSSTWTVFDSRQSWLDVDRARHLHEAAGRQLQRTEQELMFRTLDAYFALLLARKELQVADDTVRTSEANLQRTRDRFEAGLVVESDLLSAQVNLAARKQAQIRVRNAVAVARVRLNHELGVPADSVFEPAEVLAERSLPVAPLEELEARALAQRPDLAQLQLAEAAQKKSVEMAKAAFGPRVNLFASWDTHNLSFLSNGGNNWMSGLEIEFDLFQGGARRARLAGERAARDRLAALREQAASSVRMEVRQAHLDVEAAQQQVEVARAAVAQAQESLRIIQNRYEAGLTTITDLLRGEEALNSTRTHYWEAVYRWQMSYASLELATGTLNPSSPVVTP